MTKRFKHQLIIDVTFSKALTESEANNLLDVGLSVDSLNDEIEQFFFMPQPAVTRTKVKRLSRVLPHLLKSKEIPT